MLRKLSCRPGIFTRNSLFGSSPPSHDPLRSRLLHVGHDERQLSELSNLSGAGTAADSIAGRWCPAIPKVLQEITVAC